MQNEVNFFCHDIQKRAFTARFFGRKKAATTGLYFQTLQSGTIAADCCLGANRQYL
jgi:hypothetical protein